ncbi:hypothetical protein HZS61_007672 [Fusarium oxysporum f. sp. conglutinans]|uniref:Peptidase S59 domain-containing protein n=4 Tax=Fusarium oxysporum TaxID=5507 RepID=A0A8H6LBB7_FUSOX|nr:hypothetical protein HZS61_007672 [Fusarium oxysporum f. sp. conglutinans]
MSEFGKKPFGQWQQLPTGFDAFGSNIHNSNRPYKSFSQEELRLADYALGHRYGLSFGFSGPSFGTGFGTSMQRSASGPPQTFGIGSQQGAFGTGLGSATTTTSPFGQTKAGQTFAWGQESQGPNVFGTQPDGFQRPISSQRDFGVSGSPGFGFSQRPWYGSAPQESYTSWSSPSIFQAPSQQQAQGSTSFAEAQRPSSSQPPTGSIFRTDLSTAPNPFASAATQVSALSGPLSTSQRPWGTDRYSTTQAWQQAPQLPSTEMPVGRVQVPQPFGQQTQYRQTGNLYYQVPGRPSSDIRLIQQPLQDASRATIQPQLVAKIDEITAYGPPWLFLTTEEKQQQQDDSPLAISKQLKTLEIDQDRGRDLFEDLLAMDKDQRKRVTDLTIGWENVGVIRFKHPVDFTGIDLESLLGGLVILESRSATVYPDSFGLKPPPGEGLNVPASISLESSWPRKKTKGEGLSEEEARRQVASHIERLKSVAGTSFESYSEEDGTWTFSVNHFSTYNQVMCNN